jgi:hypothetical protein
MYNRTTEIAMAFADRDFGKWSHKAIGLDTKQLDRARKVYALAVAGATDGERAAANARLDVIGAEARGGSQMLRKALALE